MKFKVKVIFKGKLIEEYIVDDLDATIRDIENKLAKMSLGERHNYSYSIFNHKGVLIGIL